MQMIHHGLKLEQARDMLFDAPIKNAWFVVHKESGRTVMSIDAPADRAEVIIAELSRIRDWGHTDEWEGDVGLAAFAARYIGEVELPSYDDEGADDDVGWEDDIPYRTQ